MIPTRLKEHLTAYRRMAREPLRYCKRKRGWDGLYGPPPWLREPGLVQCGVGDLYGAAALLHRWQYYATLQLAKELRAAHKPFYFNILDKRHPLTEDTVKFAVSETILSVLAPYYDILPELSHMGLFVSGFGEPWTDTSQPLGTQCLHRDNWDRKHVKVFVHLTDVTEDDGPLCLLPADVSTWLMKKTGHYWNCKPYRDDSEWKRYVSEKDFIKVTGPAGTVAIVDTSACLHYGSRTRAGRQRQVFVIHYTEFSAYSDAVTGEYEDINLPTCPELAQGLTGRQRLVFRTI